MSGVRIPHHSLGKFKTYQLCCELQDTHAKLVTVTRTDLTPGYQAVQSIHAAIQFTQEHPSTTNEWYTISNYLVSLAVQNEHELKHLEHRARDQGLKVSSFHEPDLNNELTAICIEPSPVTQKLVRKIPLLFKTKPNESI